MGRLGGGAVSAQGPRGRETLPRFKRLLRALPSTALGFRGTRRAHARQAQCAGAGKGEGGGEGDDEVVSLQPKRILSHVADFLGDRRGDEVRPYDSFSRMLRFAIRRLRGYPRSNMKER